LLDKSDTENDDIVQAIRFDNVLTAKLLRACNSPYFGFSEPVSSVDQAVLVLGHQQILHIVLTLAFGSSMTVPLPAYAVESNELWQHSLTTAMAAEVVASGSLETNVETSVAFTAGLLHDFGKLVLGQVINEEQQTIIRSRLSDTGLPRVMVEREILGTDHSEVGAYLLKSWNLPDEVVEAVANHHQPTLEPRPLLSAIIHVANDAAHIATQAAALNIPPATPINDPVAASLGITNDRLEQMIVEVRDSAESVGHFMAMA
ncbi:MAG: HDOD domain-containing protein, partial [Verrucomicrobiota bacterium]